jgi:hypothetical protein
MSPDTTPPKIIAARLASEDDTGVSNSDGITSDDTPSLLITADPDALSTTVTLSSGKSYTSTTKNAQGQFVVQIPEADALGDGPVTYSVVVQDAAGNASEPFSGTPFVVDRLSETLDPSPLLSLSRMTQSAFDFFQDDFLTNVARPEFDGTVTNFNAATQTLLVQVVGVSGTTLGFEYIIPDATTGVWVFTPSIELAGNNDQYLLKATVVDKAGNILKAWDQSFGVDQVVPGLDLTSGRSTLTSDWENDVVAKTSERGTFWFGDVNQKTDGSTLTLPPALKVGGGFKMGFWDWAGNASGPLSNANDPLTTAEEGWKFASDVSEIRLSQDSLAAPYKTPKTFGGSALSGSVGKLQFIPGQDTVIDVADLYQTNPAVNAMSTVNHIVMSDGVGNDTLKLTMGDVLALGVQNSFVSNGHLQMRIEGDAGDKVSLDDLVGSSSVQTWSQSTESLAGVSYKVYSNAYWGLDVFIHQAVHVTVL